MLRRGARPSPAGDERSGVHSAAIPQTRKGRCSVGKRIGRSAWRLLMGGIVLAGGFGLFSAPVAVYHLDQIGRVFA